MADIFISYASKDRNKAEELAETLSTHGWSVWWDRKIPLGKSYDEVIEKALGESKCVIVLWSAVSVVSEWVRNEASEAKRRGILVPVFVERVDAPLAFRLLNGADLYEWQAGTPNSEFDQLVERVTELLGKPQSSGSIEPTSKARSQTRPQLGKRFSWAGLSTGFVAVVAIGIAIFIYLKRNQEPDPHQNKVVSDPTVPGNRETSFEINLSELEKALRGLAVVGGSVPATAVTTAFHVPDLGLRVAFIDPQQSQSMFGSMPSGALVMEVESSGAAAKAGIHAFDIIEAIGSRKINSVDDLRDTIRKLGPGKSQFMIRRPNGQSTVLVDCPNCKPE